MKQLIQLIAEWSQTAQRGLRPITHNKNKEEGSKPKQTNQPTNSNQFLPFCFGGIDGIGVVGCSSFMKEKRADCCPNEREEKRRQAKATNPAIRNSSIPFVE